MPVLYILCGLPFSGKTTLAREIARDTDSVLVSYDALWREQWDETGRSFSFEELSAIAEGRLSQALAHGSSAVYDTLHNSRGWRDRLRTLAANHGADSIVVYLNTPIDRIEQRRVENERTGTRHHVSAETICQEILKFETPGPDEDIIEFTPDTDIPSWLARMKKR